MSVSHLAVLNVPVPAQASVRALSRLALAALLAAGLAAPAGAANHNEPRVKELTSQLFAGLDDASSQIALVEHTLDVVGPKLEHGKWLDEAAASGGDATKIAALRAKPEALSGLGAAAAARRAA